MQEHILPPTLEDNQRVMRLINILSRITDKQYAGFLSILKKQAQTIHDCK